MSRRRRRIAMMAIGGGLAALRPVLWRSAFLLVALLVLAVLLAA